MTSFQGRQWVVGYGHYYIVGNNLIHNSQEIILTPRTTRFVVKIVQREHEVNDIRPLFSVKPFSFDFIELSNSSLGDNLTPHSLSTISPNLIFQFGSLQP
jgi:hypothetical protein